MAANPQPRLTPEQYLEIERAADFRSEYYDGQMYAMSGGSYAHARLTASLIHEFGEALADGPCAVASSDLRVRVSPDGLYTYPDLSVICGAARLADDQNDTLLNPTLLCEVLSPSTEASDRGFKFSQYRMIESFKTYMLVSQWEHRVEIFQRQENGEWVLSEATALDGVCKLRAPNCTIPLAGIYRGVTLSARPLRAETTR
jgi:Uma2 family endonuclease